MLRRSSTFFALMLTTAHASADETIEQAFVQKKIAKYETALGGCMAKGDAAAPPDSHVLEVLRSYPQRDVEVFLIAHASEMEDECSAPQLGELAVALNLVAAADDISPDTQRLLAEVRGMVFSSARWGLKRQYLELPENMKVDLKTLPVFQKPFNSMLIRDRLAEK